MSLWFLLAAPLRAPCAPLQSLDAHAEVAAAVYAAFETSEEAEKAADKRILALQVQIAMLEHQVKAGEAQRRAELTEAQEGFVAQLADKDRAYAQSIAVFRGDVTDIASTPEGLAALAQFNAGDEAGALAVLDRLRAAHDEARRKRIAVESSAEGRRIAALALDARNRGKADTPSVIKRFEEVTRLDPSVSQAWSDLAALYLDVGRLGEAEHAVNSAIGVAGAADEKARAFQLLGRIRWVEGDLTGAAAAYSDSVDAWRKVVAQSPASDDAQLGLALALQRRAYALDQQLGVQRGREEEDESLDLVSQAGFTTATRYQWEENLSAALVVRASGYGRRVDFDDAWKNQEAALAIYAAHAAAQASDSRLQSGLGRQLSRLADIEFSQGKLVQSENNLKLAISTLGAVVILDPLVQNDRREIASASQNVGIILLTNGEYENAQDYLQKSLSAYQQLSAVDKRNFTDRVWTFVTMFELSLIPGSKVELADALKFADQNSPGHTLNLLEWALMRKLRHIVTERAGETDRIRVWPFFVQEIGDSILSFGDLYDAAQSYHLAHDSARRLAVADPHPADLENLISVCAARLEKIRLAGQAAKTAGDRRSATKKAPPGSGAGEPQKVIFVDIAPILAQALQRPGLQGAVAVDIAGGSADGGLQVGDIVIAIDGAPVSGRDQISDRLAGMAPGVKVAFEVLRGGSALALATIRPTTPRP